MTRDELIRDLRNPKLNAAETMRNAADEIERLRALITAWADAENAAWGTEGGRLENACEALRKAVGR